MRSSGEPGSKKTTSIAMRTGAVTLRAPNSSPPDYPPAGGEGVVVSFASGGMSNSGGDNVGGNVGSGTATVGGDVESSTGAAAGAVVASVRPPAFI
eukprot:CAMPEP_0194483362 /NCGR_PEP_ID=MMETSP0253-20130528/5014_1 /TAXON_ID=2966 /ORGANISM="Noctiluca scintillans" /LENGTH=95 /DNA_ID=CAMNT_0039323023 /DNA_START=67 /DNA_END=355 /DNA_ORIENTATION=+